MKPINAIKLLTLSLVLTSCGGGSSGGGTPAANNGAYGNGLYGGYNQVPYGPNVEQNGVRGIWQPVGGNVNPNLQNQFLVIQPNRISTVTSMGENNGLVGFSSPLVIQDQDRTLHIGGGHREDAQEGGASFGFEGSRQYQLDTNNNNRMSIKGSNGQSYDYERVQNGYYGSGSSGTNGGGLQSANSGGFRH